MANDTPELTPNPAIGGEKPEGGSTVHPYYSNVSSPEEARKMVQNQIKAAKQQQKMEYDNIMRQVRGSKGLTTQKATSKSSTSTNTGSTSTSTGTAVKKSSSTNSDAKAMRDQAEAARREMLEEYQRKINEARGVVPNKTTSKLSGTTSTGNASTISDYMEATMEVTPASESEFSYQEAPAGTIHNSPSTEYAEYIGEAATKNGESQLIDTLEFEVAPEGTVEVADSLEVAPAGYAEYIGEAAEEYRPTGSNYFEESSSAYDIDISYDELESNIALLKEATKTLSSNWSQIINTNIATIKNSWAGADCETYINKVTNLDSKVQNAMAALELMTSTYEQAKNLMQEEQSKITSTLNNL